MDAIHIPHLIKKPNKTDRQEFRGNFPQLETLTPVQGTLAVSHHETYLEVQGQADTIVTLTCDRCLQHYNHRLSFDTQELIWLEISPHPETIPEEREVASEDLVETLPPQGYFEPDSWVYEQLCLAMPYRCLCDQSCPGIEVAVPEPESTTKTDHRWAALAALKPQLPS